MFTNKKSDNKINKKSNKKATSIMTMTVWIVVALFAAAIVMFGISNMISNSNKAIELSTFQDKIDACDYRLKNKAGFDFNPEEHDKDSNNIIDECQLCFFDITDEEIPNLNFEDADGSLTTLGKRKHNLDSPTRSFSTAENMDKDHDGVHDACDSDDDRKAKRWLGFIGNTIASECRKIEEYVQSGMVRAEVREDNEYTQCLLKYYG